MEMIDLYNPDGSPAGKTVPRSEAHRLGLLHKTVHIWVASPAGDLLLQKRAMAKESHPGLWDISAAGHITAGDSSVRAAVRELEEEIGIIAAERDLRFLFALNQRFDDPEHEFFDREITDVYLLRREIDPAAIRIDTGEVEAVRLISVNAFRKELAETPAAFTPHGEEYDRVMRIVEAKDGDS
jgi:isopentenyldiphosphate isomerase